MAFSWTAKVHKTGSKVRIYDGSRFVKEVVASAETYAPVEAKEFANELLAELQSQSKKADKDITVRTPAEVQTKSLKEVKQNASGLDPKDCTELQDDNLETIDVEDETEDQADETNEEIAEKEAKIAKLMNVVASYKKALHQEKVDRVTERKARRGLAIAKQLVANGTLKNDYEVIRTKVAEIVDMETREIEMLERKVAGEREFASVEDAKREARRQNRIARMHRVAAEDAQEDGDEAEADVLDSKAEEAEAKAASYAKIAQEMDGEEFPEDVEAQDDVEGVDELPEATEEQANEGMSQEMFNAADEKPVVESKEKPVAPVVEAPVETPVVEAAQEAEPVVVDENKKLAAKYRRIATKHRKLAEEFESKGDIDKADEQDEMADDADEKAEKFEEMCEAQACEAGETEMQTEEVAPVDEVPVEETEEQVDELPTEEPVEEEQVDEVAPESEELPTEEEEQTDEDELPVDEPVTAKKKVAGIKRSGEKEDVSFGIDKSASLIEQNQYSHDREVTSLSSMWKGAPRD